MKNATVIFLSLFFLLPVFKIYSQIAETEPNSMLSDEGVITISENETYSGVFNDWDDLIDWWIVENGTSGELIIDFAFSEQTAAEFIQVGEYLNNERTEGVTLVYSQDTNGNITVDLVGNKFYTIQLQNFGDIEYSFTLSGSAFGEPTSENTAPTLVSNTGIAVEEGGEVAISQANLEYSDIEQTTAELTYRIISEPTNGTLKYDFASFVIDYTTGDEFTQAAINGGAIVYEHDGSSTTTDNFVLSLSDGIATIENISVNVSETSDEISPTITSSSAIEVAENTSGTIYTATADETVAFSLGSSKDETLFTLSTDVVSFTTSPDFETPQDGNGDNIYLIDLIATDGAGNETTLEVAITVTDVDDSNPVLTSATTASFVENETGTAYTVIATDANTITYSLGSGNDEALFDIVGSTGVVIFKTAPDFESPTDADTDNAYVINVSASDGINSVYQNVTITVTDVDEIQSGSPDTSFNPTETQYGDGAGLDDHPYIAEFQSDGKILIAGGSFGTYNGDWAYGVARLHPDGSLDQTFENADINISNGAITSIIEQPDGKILVGGQFSFGNESTLRFITRLNSDGTKDHTFNPGSGPNHAVFSMALQPDGKILIGGQFSLYNGTSVTGLARLDTDGSLDDTFNQGGSGPNGFIESISLQPDNRIIIAGALTSYNGNTTIGKIGRLNEDGSLDNSFQTSFENNIAKTALQPGGKVIFSYTEAGFIVRLNADGSEDDSFQFDEDSPFEVGPLQITALSVQSGGKIMAGGSRIIAEHILVRFNEDGSLDDTFDDTNIAKGTNSLITTILVQPNGKYIIGGNYVIQ